jgi:inhibitor of growth protein 3
VKRGRDTNGVDAHSRGGSGHPPASAHPSLPVPASGRTTQNSGNDWTHAQLEGPGVPPARGASQHPAISVSATNALGLNGGGDDLEAELEGADDQDETLYCFCNRVSFGEMVACDDDNCEREWVRSVCCLESHIF